MIIKTKYKIDDMVYPIRKSGYTQFVKCDTCNGFGIVSINDTDRTVFCPDCLGRGGSKEWQSDKWYVDTNGASKIGKVATETYRKGINEKNRKVYMLDNTGVGSGTLWDEDLLFSSLEEANKECDKRNGLNIEGTTPSKLIKGGKR